MSDLDLKLILQRFVLPMVLLKEAGDIIVIEGWRSSRL